MQNFDFNLGVNDVRRIEVQANYVYYLDGSAAGADNTIALRTESGSDTILLKPGQAFRMRPGQSSARWIISNHAKAAAINGRLFLGEGDFSDNRISGSVEVIDGARNRVKANTCFIGFFSVGALAANFSHVQLSNPAANKKNLIVETIVMASTTSPSFVARQGAGEVGVLAGLGQSKLLRGSVTSTGEVRTLQAGALAGASSVYLLNGPVNTSVLWAPKEPIILPPGFSLTMAAQNVNNDVAASFEWYEEELNA